MSEIIIAVFVLIIGLILIAWFSDIAVKHAATLASLLGISSLIIGVTLVSIGTDISEIFNSIISCSLGHGDIDVGDSIGSVLTQLTLVFGLLPIICGAFIVKRKEILIIGGCEILALFMVFMVVEKGYFTRLDTLFLMGSFIIFIMVTYNVTKSDMLEDVDLIMEKVPLRHKTKKYHAGIASLAFLGVAFSSYFIIQSIITLSTLFSIHEYILSFFILAIGTSLPELAVDISALRRKQYDIAIGDIIGSCIVDATISISIGQFLFPQAVTASLAIPTILYTIVASMIVISVVAVRQKVDMKAGILFISIYLLSYFVLFIPLLQV